MLPEISSKQELACVVNASAQTSTKCHRQPTWPQSSIAIPGSSTVTRGIPTTTVCHQSATSARGTTCMPQPSPSGKRPWTMWSLRVHSRTHPCSSTQPASLQHTHCRARTSGPVIRKGWPLPSSCTTRTKCQWTRCAQTTKATPSCKASQTAHSPKTAVSKWRPNVAWTRPLTSISTQWQARWTKRGWMERMSFQWTMQTSLRKGSSMQVVTRGSAWWLSILNYSARTHRPSNRSSSMYSDPRDKARSSWQSLVGGSLRLGSPSQVLIRKERSTPWDRSNRLHQSHWNNTKLCRSLKRGGQLDTMESLTPVKLRCIKVNSRSVRSPKSSRARQQVPIATLCMTLRV